MTSRPRKDDLKTSQLPWQSTMQRVQTPEPAATSRERFLVSSASLDPVCERFIEPPVDLLVPNGQGAAVVLADSHRGRCSFYRAATSITSEAHIGRGRASALPAPHGDRARAHDLEDAQRLQQLEERFELVVGADHAQRERAAIHVDDLGLEDLGDLQRLGAFVALAGDPHQQELGGDGVVGVEVADLDHVDELVQLLGDLVHGVLVAVDDDGDAREPGVLAEAHRQALDVEAAAREQPGDPREHAGLVLDEDGEGVLHDFLPSLPWPPIISVISLPAGTMGYTFSSGEVLKSITAGRPQAMASRSAGST